MLPVLCGINQKIVNRENYNFQEILIGVITQCYTLMFLLDNPYFLNND